MNRQETILLLQLSRGLKLATVKMLASEVVSMEDTRNGDINRTRHFNPEKTYDAKTYTYKIPPSMKLEVGDTVVAPVNTPDRMVIARVTDIGSDMPGNLKYDLRWLMSKIDTSEHSRLVAEENDIMRQLQQAELKSKLAELQKFVGVPLDTIRTPLLEGSAAPDTVVDTE